MSQSSVSSRVSLRRYLSIKSISRGGQSNSKESNNTTAKNKPRYRKKCFLTQISDRLASRKLIAIKKHTANWNLFLRNITRNKNNHRDKIFLTLLLLVITCTGLYLWHGWSRALELAYMVIGFIMGTVAAPLIHTDLYEEALE